MKRGLYLVFIFVNLFCFAQEPVYVHLTEDDGLPDEEFYDVIEDNKGFVWLCADKGLFRYNGKSFDKYTNVNQKGLSVFNLYEDSSGRIWCTNISGQFFYVKKNKLTLFVDFSNYLKGELADFRIKGDFLWVFSRRSIYKINIATKAIEQTFKTEKDYGTPFSINEMFYISTGDSISYIDKKDKIKNLCSVNLPYRNKKGKIIASGKSRLFKSGSPLFFRQIRAGKNVFFEIDTVKKEIKKTKGLSPLDNKIIRFEFFNDNELWLATNNGVLLCKIDYNKLLVKKHFLKGVDVTKIIKDKDQNYWFTTLNNGIYVIPNIFIKNTSINKTYTNIVSLDKINDNTLVFGTETGDVGLYNIVRDTCSIIDIPTTDRVSTLKYLRAKDLIFISKDLNSYTFNIKNKVLIKTNKGSTVKNFSILENNDLLYAGFDNVVILKNADLESELKVITKGKRTYTSYYNRVNKETIIAYVDNLVSYDSLWKPKVIRHNNRPLYINSISKTSDGIVWASSFKNGVYGIKNNKIVYHFNKDNKLTSNHIEKIKADDERLWVALDNSIQLLNYKNNSVNTLTKSDGVVSYNISGIEVVKNKVFFSSSKGLFSIEKNKIFKDIELNLYFNEFKINNKDTIPQSDYTLKHNQNTVKIGFNINGFLYNQNNKYLYRLKGLNDNWLQTELGVNTVLYNSLSPGKYTFQVKPFLKNKVTEGLVKELSFTIKKPFWNTWLFIGGITTFCLGSTILYFRRKIKIKERERINQLQKISLEKELLNVNLTALRSQMNPHFIFNTLNSIQGLVLRQDTDASYDYIVLFAKLIRSTLNYSGLDFIVIEEELEFLHVYLELEKLRMGEDFNYTIACNEKTEIEIPSLLVQPFIENALEHGLLHRNGEKKLDIDFCFDNNTLTCFIVDNGIGRVEAAKIVQRQKSNYKSFALSAIEKRLSFFKKQYGSSIGFTIEDLYDENTPIGTKVILKIPFKNRF